MNGQDGRVDRREFVRRSMGVGAGALGFSYLPTESRGWNARPAGTPLIITSHANDTGRDAMRDGWQILNGGGSALDAVEKAANIIEVDPEDSGVGMGGLPNEDGVVALDASIMDGRTYNAGSVGALENISTPASVARLVMERTDHVMLVGKGALEFARSFGFEEENLLTEKAREIWLKWREEHSASDDWGPPDHLRDHPTDEMGFLQRQMEFHYGTTNVLAIDGNGDVAGITTTSGLSWKVPGRVGDSPIIGAGLYVDNEVGAAGATGRGEDVIKSCASFHVVMRMRDGRSPQEACEDTIELIVDKYRHVNPNFFPPEKFVAINTAGEFGCAWMGIPEGRPQMSVRDPSGFRVFEGSTRYAVSSG